ncbi:hypothetical protein BDZ89DRAFT_1072404 [Hymenopellis radicata]|nr:hypothetical protein BDZ89DRAFT_1072404 [Hymenopellis radicata]
MDPSMLIRSSSLVLYHCMSLIMQVIIIYFDEAVRRSVDLGMFNAWTGCICCGDILHGRTMGFSEKFHRTPASFLCQALTESLNVGNDGIRVYQAADELQKSLFVRAS